MWRINTAGRKRLQHIQRQSGVLCAERSVVILLRLLKQQLKFQQAILKRQLIKQHPSVHYFPYNHNDVHQYSRDVHVPTFVHCWNWWIMTRQQMLNDSSFWLTAVLLILSWQKQATTMVNSWATLISNLFRRGLHPFWLFSPVSQELMQMAANKETLQRMWLR